VYTAPTRHRNCLLHLEHHWVQKNTEIFSSKIIIWAKWIARPQNPKLNNWTTHKILSVTRFSTMKSQKKNKNLKMQTSQILSKTKTTSLIKKVFMRNNFKSNQIRKKLLHLHYSLINWVLSSRKQLSLIPTKASFNRSQTLQVCIKER